MRLRCCKMHLRLGYMVYPLTQMLVWEWARTLSLVYRREHGADG